MNPTSETTGRQNASQEPTAEQIRQRSAMIRAGWSDDERLRRTVTKPRRVQLAQVKAATGEPAE